MFIQPITNQFNYNQYKAKLSNKEKSYNTNPLCGTNNTVNITFKNLISPSACIEISNSHVHAAAKGEIDELSPYDWMDKHNCWGTNEDFWGRSAQTMAAQNGHADIIKLFMKDPHFDPNKEDGAHYRGLAVAAEHGQTDVAILYLKHPKTDPNLGSRFKIDKELTISRPAVLFAAARNDIKLLKVLKKHPKFDPNILDDTVTSAMDIALLKGYKDFAKELAADPRFSLDCVDGHLKAEVKELLENSKGTLEERKLELEKKEKAYEKKSNNLEQIIETKTTQIRKQEKAAAEKRLEKTRKEGERELAQRKAELDKREEKLKKAESAVKTKEENLEKTISQRVAETLKKERASEKIEIEQIKTDLKGRTAKLEKAEADVKEKNENLDNIISEKVSKTLKKERAIQEKTIEEAREKSEKEISESKTELKKREEKITQRESELALAEEEVQNKNKALDNLINNYKQLLAEDIEYAKSEIRASYGIKIKELPEKMTFGEQLLYVTDVLNENSDKLTDADNDTPENITRALQNDKGQISNEGLQFIRRVLQLSSTNFSEEDLKNAIKSVRGNSGFNAEKITYFEAKVAWKGNSIRNILSQVKKIGV